MGELIDEAAADAHALLHPHAHRHRDAVLLRAEHVRLHPDEELLGGRLGGIVGVVRQFVPHQEVAAAHGPQHEAQGDGRDFDGASHGSISSG